MRRFLMWALVVAMLVAATGLYVTRARSIAAEDLPPHQPSVAAGEIMFAAAGCASCHAAPGTKGEAKLVLAGGLEFKTPFGIFHAPNISTDPEHGIGTWDAAQFASAVIHGTRPDGAHYYPAFPYGSYARMRIEDVLDLKAYMDTLPADATPSKPHDLGFPFNIRLTLGGWKLMFMNTDPVLLPATDPVLARGQYLVEGPGHCGECHTPRNALGGLDTARWLAGGPNPDGPGRIPGITPRTLDWSEEDIAYYLESGFTPEFDTAGGSMVAVVENTAKLPPEDRAAIAAYLKAVPAVN